MTRIAARVPLLSLLLAMASCGSGDGGAATELGGAAGAGSGGSAAGGADPGGSGAAMGGSLASGGSSLGGSSSGGSASAPGGGAGGAVSPTGGAAGAPAVTPDAGAPLEPESRCRVTDSTVFCEHHVTPLTAGPTIVRDVYWQTPLTAAPVAGYPIVILYQGSLFGPALTWGELNTGVPFGGFYQGLLQARLLDSGFTVVAPAAAGGAAWQTNSGLPYETTTDHVFIQALLEGIGRGEYGPADPSRYYATGISSGGYMTSRMAASYPGIFRALAIQSGSYATCLGPICNVPATLPADHPPTLFLHGSVDATVPLVTAQTYYDRLLQQGFETEMIVDPVAGHEWLAVAPEEVTAWFEQH